MGFITVKQFLFYTVSLFMLLLLGGCGDLTPMDKSIFEGYSGTLKISTRFHDRSQANSGTLQTAEAGVPEFICLTLRDSNGDVVAGYDSAKLQLRLFGGNYITDLVELPPGIYYITEYMVLDSNEETIYIAPVVDSQGAQLVSEPLPMAFNISHLNITQVFIDVVDVLTENPDDYGYSSFAFSYISTLVFRMGIAMFDTSIDEWTFGSATVTVSSGGEQDQPTQIHYQGSLSTPGNVQVPRGKSPYSITIVKSGYDSITRSFTEEELQKYLNTMLVFQLKPNQ